MDFDSHCNHPSRGNLCRNTAGVSFVLLPSEFAFYRSRGSVFATRRILMYRCYCFSNSDEARCKGLEEGLVAHMLQKASNGHLIYDPVGKRLGSQDSSPHSSGNDPSQASNKRRIEWLFHPPLRSNWEVKLAYRERESLQLRISALSAVWMLC